MSRNVVPLDRPRRPSIIIPARTPFHSYLPVSLSCSHRNGCQSAPFLFLKLPGCCKSTPSRFLELGLPRPVMIVSPTLERLHLGGFLLSRCPQMRIAWKSWALVRKSGSSLFVGDESSFDMSLRL
ncbi:hypothetical protein MLD38_017852 [Melastoma candidum]|uniref:Uncharacterized protein n=1 Tax=Melastoma candidum TaxID=119954 RepID=A0ACB9R080_9MYRT|nr:hypothetical protein MLD38_017852 [Melastoma candidum]